ncbi:hypothetical protein DL93DRAFT_2169579 [Clavulina sp. PMI_390]|nr:hypothetical protein DL93DRAFT_2169579 [Clavulina sp. PMI_390]
MPLQTSKIADATVTTVGYGTMGIGGVAYGVAAGTEEERFDVFKPTLRAIESS